jgi:hypothetical protein
VSHRTPEEEGLGRRLESKEEEEEEWRPEPQNHKFGGEGRYPTRKEVRAAREEALILARQGMNLAGHDPREVQSSLSTRLSSSSRNSNFSDPPPIASERRSPPNVVSIPGDNPSTARHVLPEPNSLSNAPATAALPTGHEELQVPIALRREDHHRFATVDADATIPSADYDTPQVREERRQRLAQYRAELKAKAGRTPL